MSLQKKSETKALVPKATIEAFSRSIYKEASNYGFSQIDVIKLINCLMDLCSDGESDDQSLREPAATTIPVPEDCAELPIKGPNVQIRAFDEDTDFDLLASWLPDRYGRYFVLSCATAQQITVESLVNSPSNHLGIVTTPDGRAIGAMAYLDHSRKQRRAELRKLIGDPERRGKGLAEEATRLWVQYGISGLGLRKIYVSTLQTQIANIKLNENIGFKVEGLLRNEVLIDGERHDVLRMGLCVTSDDDSQSN
jgi:RimJ/RimL family protein N-acetyltransferase